MTDHPTDDPALESVRLIAIHAKSLADRIRELEALGNALADAARDIGTGFINGQAHLDAALDAWKNR